MDKILRLKKEFFTSFLDDWIGLWELIYMVKNIIELTEQKEVKKFLLEFVLDLLKENLILAGFPHTDGSFQKWEGKPKEIVMRIKQDWENLDKEVNVGDVIWFDITEKGEALLNKLQNMS